MSETEVCLVERGCMEKDDTDTSDRVSKLAVFFLTVGTRRVSKHDSSEQCLDSDQFRWIPSNFRSNMKLDTK